MSGQPFRKQQRNRLKRSPARGSYDRETVFDILDSGILCHVGYYIDAAPYVTPTCYWREDDQVYWHGAAAGTMLKHEKNGVPVCFTVSHLDGIVMARSAFHHSINYRSVMAFGNCEVVANPAEKNRQLERFMERIAPGRWAEVRPPSARELRLTTVMRLQLDEVVAKTRAGSPIDDEADYALPVWAGVLPIHTQPATMVDDSRLAPGARRPRRISRRYQ